MLDTKNHSRMGSALMALLAGAALFGGCATDETQAVGEELDRESDLGGSHGIDVILDWNEIAYNAATTAGYFGPLLFHHDRGYTMLHIAQHDALNAITKRYEQYTYTGSDRFAHPIAAAAQAARDVLVNVYPAQAPTFDAALATWLASVPSGSAKTKGIALGKASAAKILSLRSTDGIADAGTYTPGTGPGKYQYVAPFEGFILHPALKTFKPFGVATPSQFRVGPPPALTSSAYATAYNEVKAKGGLNNHTRTQTETEYAAFWWELSDAGWNRIARVVAEQEHLGLWRTARLFALNNMALLDGYITGWDSKFHYDFWRPTTAIRAGATDSNSATAPDAAWESFQTVPPVQDHPSTHSVLGKASAIVIADSLRDDTVTFTFTSPTALAGKPTRTFQSFSGAAAENADSRIMAGLHFRFATTAGMTLGQKVGNYIVQNRLRAIGWQSLYD